MLVSDDQSRMTVPNVEIRPKTRIRTRSLPEARVVRQQSRRAGIVLGPTTGRAPAPVFHPRRDGCIQPRPIGTALAAGNDAVDATHSAVRPTGVDLHGGMLAPCRWCRGRLTCAQRRRFPTSLHKCNAGAVILESGQSDSRTSSSKCRDAGNIESPGYFDKIPACLAGLSILGGKSPGSRAAGLPEQTGGGAQAAETPATRARQTFGVSAALRIGRGV